MSESQDPHCATSIYTEARRERGGEGLRTCVSERLSGLLQRKCVAQMYWPLGVVQVWL